MFGATAATYACLSKHFHRRAKQFFFVLDGTLTLEKAGEVFKLGSRQGIQVDPGIPHEARNTTDQEVVFLVISAPGSRGDRVEE
ncbi:MAG: cupin domain-containing protein [Pseudomonadota bacterium]